MIERIRKIIEVENIGLVKFAEEIGVGSSALSHYLGGRNKVSLELVTKILERFRGINPEWLLFGRGEMYKSADAKLTNPEPDLFSSAESKQAVPLTAKEDEKLDDNTVKHDFLEPESFKHEEIPTVDNVQNVEYERYAPEKQVQNTRASIEKIIVIYSDCTFDCYSPNGHRL